MNKQKFTKIIQNYHNIPDDDREKLHELAKTYPYSQVIHTLVAKANHDAQTSIASQTLNYAAMYATDRGVLKDVIQLKATHTNAPELTRPATIPSGTKEVDEVNPSAKTPVDSKPDQTPVISREEKKITVNLEEINPEGDLIRDEIWFELEALKKSKATYMEWLKETTTGSEDTLPIAGDEKAPKTSEKTSTQKEKKDTKKHQETTPDIKSGEETAKKKLSVKKGTKAKKKKEEKPKKKNKAPKAPKEDQNKLIENFISKEPSITAKPLKSSENQPDLSAASTSFNEDLVSENLANIFINQGKRDKAIDIYKKLIWKFPQKKAYFASRIEELQK
ncbi:hypothetical protein C900_05121 [Fulvivirga imtechensis AK7]|uniref:Tetratricopeptide repeat protein n=1 Tax=Fulvivirga imtechensis AK7 TaxID=1237149 RepID=L8JKB2_9BACT|nr:tetratricopeptide repeat protein [Fulvivirga imtechensis]ELR69341.1 hypothetical protein C900_05121 [Fulvivirga imtechensis AK7]